MLDTTMRRDVIERRHIQDASDDTRALGSFSSPTRDDAAERAQFHTNNRRWSWLIMHYRGGVLQLLFFCFCCFASHVISPAFLYLSRSAFVFWISRIRGTALRLTKFGRAFSTCSVQGRFIPLSLFGFWAWFSLYCFAFAIQPPHAQRQYTYWTSYLVVGPVFLPRDHDYSCIEREKERQLVFYFTVSVYQLTL